MRMSAATNPPRTLRHRNWWGMGQL
jgi:hypothetical protein